MSEEPVEDAIEQAQQRYLAAMHAMGAGVEMKMNVSPGDTSPKHLRVGVNSAMIQTSALAKLLMDKGIITGQEWYEALADLAEAEVKLYEKFLEQTFGAEKITLR